MSKLNLSSNMPPLYKTWVEGRSVSLSQVNSLQVNIFYRLFWGSHPRIEARILLAVIQIIWNDDDAGFTRAWYVSSIRAPKNPACKICLLTRQGFSPIAPEVLKLLYSASTRDFAEFLLSELMVYKFKNRPTFLKFAFRDIHKKEKLVPIVQIKWLSQWNIWTMFFVYTYFKIRLAFSMVFHHFVIWPIWVSSLYKRTMAFSEKNKSRVRITRKSISGLKTVLSGRKSESAYNERTSIVFCLHLYFHLLSFYFRPFRLN